MKKQYDMYVIDEVKDTEDIIGTFYSSGRAIQYIEALQPPWAGKVDRDNARMELIHNGNVQIGSYLIIEENRV